MGKEAQCWTGQALAWLVWIAFPDLTVGKFLTGKPGLPRRDAAGAIEGGAAQNGVGINNGPVRVKHQGTHLGKAWDEFLKEVSHISQLGKGKPQGTDTRNLTVANVDPAAIVPGNHPGTVRKNVPGPVSDTSGPGRSRRHAPGLWQFAIDGNNPGRKPRRRSHSIHIRSFQRTYVGKAARQWIYAFVGRCWHHSRLCIYCGATRR